MRFIGITGGVGAGKSAILSYLAEKPNTKVMLADEIAHDLMEPGTDCYRQIVEQFKGLDIFTEGMSLKEDGQPFDRIKLAKVIFSDSKRREQMNAIVHPAVKAFVRKQYAVELDKGELEYLVLEAALLIEEEYDEISENVWVAKSAKVAPTAYINGPAIIGKDAEIRHCAFIRGNAIVGEGAVVGNSTELKNVILFNKVQVPHYNYVGDSVLGYKANRCAYTSNHSSDKICECHL